MDLDTDRVEKPLKHNLTNLLTANKNTVRYRKQYELSGPSRISHKTSVYGVKRIISRLSVASITDLHTRQNRK